MRYLKILVMCCLLPPAKSVADGPTVTWTGEVRIRGEADGRDFRNATPPMLYTLLRTRLGATVKPTDRVRIVIQLQDSRYFGQEGSGPAATTANSKNVDLFQGYIQLDDFLVEGLSPRLGRQSLSYGNERLVGRGSWGNTGRSFDALVLRYGWGRGSVDVLTSNVVETQMPPGAATPASVAYSRDEGLLFSGLFFTSQWSPGLNSDLFLFHEWNRKETLPGHSDLSRFTPGTRLHGTFDVISYGAEGALQLGNISRTDIQAFFLGGSVQYALPSVTFTAGIDYLSGTPAGSVKFKAFYAVYQTGHRFYGFMDYFVNIPVATGEQGLQDFYLRGEIQVTSGYSLSATLHHFELTEPTDGKRILGQELDLVAVVEYGHNVSFEGGLAAFLPDELMRLKFGGGDVAWWGYLTTRAWF